MHEMLCRPLAIEFDNRMLQVKKQLRVEACRFVPSFPLLYSKFIREKNYGQTNADSPTAGGQRRGKVTGRNNHRRQLLNP
ncbi:MAG: hypothetical protein JWQ49_2993 [Edaphobacter sp.]|nr:hypothetical protein [Edaphobacter sp.]